MSKKQEETPVMENRVPLELTSKPEEIFEITGELGVDRVKIGDFLEKKSDGYYTLFTKDNIVINNINELNDKD